MSKFEIGTVKDNLKNIHFRENTQYGLSGRTIRNIQYRVLNKIDFAGKHVLEIGAGAHMDHIQYWNTMPKSYTAADIDSENLFSIDMECDAYGVPAGFILLTEYWREIDFKRYDIVIAFNVLEHLEPVSYYIRRFKDIKVILVGSIPAEGGMAWRLGRRLTSWRFLKKNDLDPVKEVSRQHKTCSRCVIAGILRENWDVQYHYWPFAWSRNLSLILNIYTKEV